MFDVFKLNSYFCNGIKYRLMVHVNENDCNKEFFFQNGRMGKEVEGICRFFEKDYRDN